MTKRAKLNWGSLAALLVFVFFAFGSSDKDSSDSGSGSSYERTSPGYDPNAPKLPRHEGDVEPLYNEVERRKKEQGIDDKEAVKQIIEEHEKSKKP